MYWQRRAIPVEVASAIPAKRSYEWLTIAIPLFLIASMQMLIVRMDIILLGAIDGREQAGIYAAASRVADLVVFALAAANAIVAPMISGFHARDDMSGLQHVMKLLAKGVLAFTVPLVILVVIYGHDILGIFGDGYQIGYAPLLILVCGQLVNALSGPVDFLMYMTGHQKQSLRILVLATVLNLMLNLVLIPFYGLVGAAIATATTTMFWNHLMRRFVRSNLGIEASVLVLFRSGLRN
jgi:O-antigen/teichoic acid export membrane protein